jgi:hypothetical protein
MFLAVTVTPLKVNILSPVRISEPPFSMQYFFLYLEDGGSRL